MRGVNIAPAISQLKFCGHCSARFEEGQLLPTFKYCIHCGKELPPWLINFISRGVLAATPPMTPAANRQRDLSQTDQEMEDININENEGSIVSPSRGRGKSYGRGRRSRGGMGREIESLMLSPLSEHQNLPRGMRSVTRPDYRVKEYYRTLYSKSKRNNTKPEVRNHPLLSLTEQSPKKGRKNFAPGSSTQVTSYFECC